MKGVSINRMVAKVDSLLFLRSIKSELVRIVKHRRKRMKLLPRITYDKERF